MRLLFISHYGRQMARHTPFDSEYDAVVQECGSSTFWKENRSNWKTPESIRPSFVQIIPSLTDVAESDTPGICCSEERNSPVME